LAIIERAKRLASVSVTWFVNIEGKGAQAVVDGAPVLLGNRRLMEEQKVDFAGLQGKAETLNREGRTVVYVARSSGSRSF
jgi:Cu2+-exporting ATPase